MINSIVIVGAGQAGFQAAASLRQCGFSGSITLVGDEPGPPYLRPPLSKAYLLGKATTQELAFRPQAFFDENRIELVEGRVESVDRTRRRVRLRSGGTLGYDHLVLATGARHRELSLPGADFQGVLGLRTLSDADALKARLASIENVVVVGAGFIGLEFAAVARALGACVHVLEVADRPMARVVSAKTADFFACVHSASGVNLHFRQGLAGIHGDEGRVTSVKLMDGAMLPAAFVVVGIGAVPNIELAADAGLEIDNGIKVDCNLLTSDPAISAIGDCAFFPDVHAGRGIRLESVQNAADQGRAVAARLTGKPEAYAAVPWFWTDQYDLKLQISGLSTGHDESVVTGSLEERSFSVLLFKRGQLVAVESVNRASDFMAARKLLAKRLGPSPAEAVASGFELRKWAAENL
ncbi:FAD-dependent oxidoreductase [Ramlibacter sp. 2FC]|uniref:NAD(P)/FAD-dependent oxidoreductase n=1 Tax=Ramlibacter sp. 2FC TaxID=2502188 RepID=UPI0010FA2516|nr:FAD-dependent oxidoreductase [Ramlibacter sp. 2FC]